MLDSLDVLMEKDTNTLNLIFAISQFEVNGYYLVFGTVTEAI